MSPQLMVGRSDPALPLTVPAQPRTSTPPTKAAHLDAAHLEAAHLEAAHLDAAHLEAAHFDVGDRSQLIRHIGVGVGVGKQRMQPQTSRGPHRRTPNGRVAIR